jgi:hypothetical protein
MPDPPQCTIFAHFQPSLQHLMDSSKTTQVELSTAHSNRQESLNYAAAAAARIYEIHPSTLAWRHKSLTVS